MKILLNRLIQLNFQVFYGQSDQNLYLKVKWYMRLKKGWGKLQTQPIKNDYKIKERSFYTYGFRKSNSF